MKKISIIFTIFIILTTFCSCKKCIHEETKTVSTVVVDKKHISAYSTTSFIPIRTGKTTMFVPQTHHHAEQNNVKIKYNKLYHTFNDKKLYNAVEIGDNILVVLKIKKYNDNSITEKIIDWIESEAEE